MGKYDDHVLNYEGKGYRYIDGEWYTADWVRVHLVLSHKLTDTFMGERWEVMYKSIVVPNFGSLNNATPKEAEILLKTEEYEWLRSQYSGKKLSKTLGVEMKMMAKKLGIDINFKEVLWRKIREKKGPLYETRVAANRRIAKDKMKRYEKDPDKMKELITQAKENIILSHNARNKKMGRRLNALHNNIIKPKYGSIKSMKRGDIAKLIGVVSSGHPDFVEEHYKGVAWFEAAFYRDMAILREMEGAQSLRDKKQAEVKERINDLFEDVIVPELDGRLDVGYGDIVKILKLLNTKYVDTFEKHYKYKKAPKALVGKDIKRLKAMKYDTIGNLRE